METNGTTTRSRASKEADRQLVRRIVRRFNGPTNLARTLKRYYPDEAVTTKAVNMWIWRGSIPGRWFLRLQEISAKQGRALLDRKDWKRTVPKEDKPAGPGDESWMD